MLQTISTVQSVFQKMNVNYRKKKQPEVVRAALLEATAEMIVEKGLNALTLDAVAERAGVSKGGLIHHFASKQILLEELNREILGEYGKFIDDYIAADPEPRGRFIRAYIRSFFTPLKYPATSKLFKAFALEMSHDEAIHKLCADWYWAILEKHGEQEHQPLKAQMLQFAADGLWMEECTGLISVSPAEREAIIDYLIQQTYEL